VKRLLCGFAIAHLACGGASSNGASVDGGQILDGGPILDDNADDIAPTDNVAETDAAIDVTTDRGQPVDARADIEAGVECRALAMNRGAMPPDGVCPADAGMPRFRRYACLPAPDGATCEEAYSEACILNTYACALSQRALGIWCGPLVDSNGQCCYVTFGDCLID
jgi:hypothetical protein